MSYVKVLKKLCLPDAVVALASGELHTPVTGFDAPAKWFGYPPALIPILSESSGPSYLGYWKHWFVERESSFVKMYVDSDRALLEIARNAEQFFGVLIIDAISQFDGLSQEIKTFAKEIGEETGGVTLSDYDRVSLETGDDLKGLHSLEVFQIKTPLAVIQDQTKYTGSFPCAANIAKGFLNHSCPFELNNGQAENRVAGELPSWYVSLDKEQLFYEYVSDCAFDKAWFTLNSPGWSIRSARRAIKELQAYSKDEGFDLLVDAWLDAATEDAGGY